MPLILQLETATTSCSVALALNGEVLTLKELTERNVHASSVTVFIDEVMKQAGKTYADLNAIAVSMGPGSYTGLRIGVSTAKGLCYALDIPLIAVSTLAAMVQGAISRTDAVKPNAEVLYCPMIDARRMEVYTAVYADPFQPVEPVHAKIIDDQPFPEFMDTNKVVFFGDGADKLGDNIFTSPGAILINGFTNSAVDMSQLALQKFTNADFEDVAYFEPFYLKDFIALKKGEKK